jgi:hypothetical protein
MYIMDLISARKMERVENCLLLANKEIVLEWDDEKCERVIRLDSSRQQNPLRAWLHAGVGRRR